MCCMRLAGNTGRKNDAKNRRLRTISQLCRAVSSQLRHVSTIGKKVKQQYLPHTTCHHTMVNFGSLTAEIGSLFWGTPANFNGLCILPSLLQRCRLAEVNQTLHDVWPSPRLVYDIYLGLLSAVGILLGAKNRFTSNSCVLLLTYCSVTARHSTSECDWANLCGMVQGMEFTELSQRASPIIGWAAIKLGIGPHSVVSTYTVSHKKTEPTYFCL